MRILFFILISTLVSGCAFFVKSNRTPAQEQISSGELRPKSSPKNFTAPFPIPDECTMFINGLPTDYEFGWVKSLEDPRRIDLPPVYTFIITEEFRTKLPSLIFNGGPNSDSHGVQQTTDKVQEVLNRPLWIVFIDQRGTGCSTPYPKRRKFNEYIFWGARGIVRDAEKVRGALGVKQWNLFWSKLWWHDHS